MKLDIKKVIAIAGLITCVAAPVAQAQWTLMEDFESYAEGNYVKDGSPDLIYPMATNGGQGQMDIYSEATSGVVGIGGDKAAHFWYGTINANAGDVWHYMPLPEPIAVGETVTIYFRLWQLSPDCNYHFGLTQLAAGDQPDGQAAWGNMANILRYDVSEPVMLDAHNGSGYSPSYPIYTPAPTVWHEYWMVVDNSWDTSGETPVVTGGWWLYRRGPDDVDPVLMTWGTEADSFSVMGFRNKTADTMKSFFLSQTGFAAAGSATPYLIDDIWLHPGECTEVPPAACATTTTWCGLDVVDGNVDTGDWMGWIYVAECPDGGPGWIYNYNVGKWLYIAGCPAAEGAWVYAINE